MAEDDFKSQLSALFPEKLDDILKKNREQLRFEYVKINELSDLEKELPQSPVKGTLEDAFLYKRIITESGKEPICLVGFNSDAMNGPWHTSSVVAVDPANNMVLTATGSLYKVKNFVEGEGHQNLLLHICAVAWADRWGAHFGVPNIFY